MATEAQTSNSVLLVRPASFGFHAEAAESNAFAKAADDPDLHKQRPSRVRRAGGAADLCRGRGAGPGRQAQAAQAGRDLPQQLGVVPRRRDDGALPNGHESSPAGTQRRWPEDAARVVRVRRAKRRRPQLPRTPRPLSRRHGQPDPRPARAPRLRQRQPAHRRACNRRLRRPARLFHSAVRSRRPVGQADLSHQRASEPGHALCGAVQPRRCPTNPARC